MSRRPTDVDRVRIRNTRRNAAVAAQAPMPSGHAVTSRRALYPEQQAPLSSSNSSGPSVHSNIHYEKFRGNGKYDLNQTITNKKNNRRFYLTELLGKGGFAKVYLCRRITYKDGMVIDAKEKLACKVVQKESIKKQHQRDKMTLEIKLHQRLSHPNIVQFSANFEDDRRVFVILEYCQNRSLMEVSKRRGTLTQPELRYYMKQFLSALIYIHDLNILHRDLKLSNILLGKHMVIKLADFGLAVQVTADHQKRTTLCGTPNYIAPEILMKVGHGKPADVWSAGVVMFALLIGTPPFETNSLKATYSRIKNNHYEMPAEYTNQAAGDMIKNMLSAKPEHRKTVHQLYKHRFITHGFCPEGIPDSAMTTMPNFNQEESFCVMAEDATGNRRFGLNMPAGVGEHDHARALRGLPRKLSTVEEISGGQRDGRRPFQEVNDDVGAVRNGKQGNHAQYPDAASDGRSRTYKSLTRYTSQILEQLAPFALKNKSSRHREPSPLELENAVEPSIRPVFWISKWVDYSDKYGLGYTLIDESVGVLFNDSYRLILHRNGLHVQVVSPPNANQGNSASTNLREEMVIASDLTEANNRDMYKMFKLLKHFRGYMTEQLVCAGENYAPTSTDTMRRLPYLVKWFRTSKAIILMLSNGVVQINFFSCHSKLFFDPPVEALTYIDSDRQMTTYHIRKLHSTGVHKPLLKLILYAKTMIENLHQHLHPYSGITGKMVESNGKFIDTAARVKK